jgi:polar amino acid transport system substrate-binding protein
MHAHLSPKNRRMSRLATAATLLGLAVAATACSTTGSVPPSSVLPTAVNSSSVMPAGASVVHPAPTPVPASNCTASYLPPSPMPTAGEMPAGSWMSHIVARGYLVAGVDQSTNLWAYRNPTNGQLQGFDIDMLEQVNQAIFGANAPPIDFKIVPNADRSKAVATGEVDIVAETMTINCERQTRSSSDPYPVDFSTVYYNAAEKLLVPTGSTITGPANLGHKRVCATGGADSLGNLVAQPGARHIVAWDVNDWADCLVMLQQGQVDAIGTDDAILTGLHAQDPNTSILSQPFSPEPYGMAISQKHPDFTAFVNGVLAKERADGTWEALYNADLLPYTGQAQTPPAPTYKAAT